MSTTLLFLLPIGMLAVAWSLSFVGCDPVFPIGGLPNPYSNVVLAESSLIAYWPLNDAMGSPPPPPFPSTPTGSSSIGTAADLSGQNHIGSYLIPPDYPANPVGMSAPITSAALTLRPSQGSIVLGDGGSADKVTSPSCADFEGGYVSIPWNTQTSSSPQLSAFTFEAWIAVPQPAMQFWTDGTVVHDLFGAMAGDGTGFAIIIDQNNSLQLIIGNGTPSGVEAPTGITIDPTDITYLAVSFDGHQFSFFAQAVDEASPMTPPAIGSMGYTATAPGTPVTFFIGAGGSDQPLRTPTMNPDGAPENPFMGLIQSVALYSPPLDSTDIQSHYSSGALGD